MAPDDSLLYFAGGLRTQADASDTNGGGGLHSVGGVTVSANPLFAPTLAQMASYMGADGGPLYPATDATYADNGATDTVTKNGAFADGLEGIVAYLFDGPSWGAASAWVVITASNVNSITFATINKAAAVNVAVNVGGAFETPQAMVENADDADTANMLVHMFYNVAEPLMPITTFDLDGVITGTIAHNAWVILESYTTTPGDGGRTKWTGDASARVGANIDNCKNLIWRHPEFYDPDQSTNPAIVIGTTDTTNIFIEDIYTDGWNGVVTLGANSVNTIFIGGSADNAGGYLFYGPGSGNCTVYDFDMSGSGGANGGGVYRVGAVTFVNCNLSNTGGKGIRGRDTTCFITAINCTIDGSGDAGVEVTDDAATIVLINSTVSNSGAENINEGTGSIYATYTNTYNPGATDVFLAGAGMLAVDPLFTDPGGNDYSLQSASQLIGAGKPDVGGGERDIGAVAFWNVTSANYPAAGDVEEAVDYGHNDQFTGAFVVPAEGNVVVGVQYGADGTEFTGAFVVPAEGNVLFGVTYGYNDQFTGALDVTPPNAPSFTVTAGTNAATLTIDGDAGVTNYVRYKGSADIDWLDGGSRSGDGDVVVSGLDNDVPYIFDVYSVDGAGNNSTPGVAVINILSAVSTNEIDSELVCMAVEQLAAHGEEVTYWPRGGGFRQIQVIADRDDDDVTAVWAVNDSVIGISSSEFDGGGDTVEIARRKGKIPVKRRITNIGAHDAGMVRYDLAAFNYEKV